MRLSVSATKAQPSEHAMFVAQNTVINPDAIAIGANTGGRSLTNYVFRDGLDLGYTTLVMGVEAVSGANRITEANGTLGGFSFSDTIQEGWMVAPGTTARVYRMGADVTRIRESAVADHGCSGWTRDMRFVGTTGTRTFNTYNRTNVPQWFAVRAYDAAGNVGPLSNVVSVTTPASWSETAGTATTDSNKTLTGNETGALGAPTISIAAGWPSNRSVTITVTAAASGSVEGYVVYISDYDPANHRGFFLDLADDGGAALLPGDMVIYQRPHPIYSVSQKSNRVAEAYGGPPGGKAFLHWFSWPSDEPGKTWQIVEANPALPNGRGHYTEITMNAGQSNRAAPYMFCGAANPAQDRAFYTVMQPGIRYRAEIWARADAARSITINMDHNTGQTLTVRAINDVPANTNITMNGTNPALCTWNLTTAWQKFSVEWEVDQELTGNSLGRFGPVFNGPGRFDISDFVVYDATLNKTFGLPSSTERAFFEQAAFSHIREHRIVKTRGFASAYDVRSMIVTHLHPTLTACVDLGIPEFWFQPEFYLHEDDWPFLVEYLFAPDGTGDATALRAALGRTGPWSDDFTRIFWELSNETWQDGSIAEFYFFPNNSAEWYGKFQQYVIDQLKASPHWTTAVNNKVEFVIGGWQMDISLGLYGNTAIEHTPDTKWHMLAAYIGGWDNPSFSIVPEEPSGYRALLYHSPTWQKRTIESYQARNAASATARGDVPVLAGTYEYSIGYPLPSPGVSTDALDRAAKSVAGGTAVFDKTMMQYALGWRVQSYFTAKRGRDWSAQQFEDIGNALYPDAQWLSLFNRECAGSMHAIAHFRPVLEDGVQVASDSFDGFADIACYVTSNGTRRSVILVNRNLPYDSIDSGDALYDASDTGVRTVRVRPSWSTASTLTRHHMIGAYNAQNFDSSAASYAELSITATPLGAHSGDLVVTLPPASAEVYIFEGVS